MTKLKAFADNKFNVAQMTISVFDGETTLWEKAGFPLSGC